MAVRAAARRVAAAQRRHKAGLRAVTELQGVCRSAQVQVLGGEAGSGESGERERRGPGLLPESGAGLSRTRALHTALCTVLRGCQFRLFHVYVTNTLRLD